MRIYTSWMLSSIVVAGMAGFIGGMASWLFLKSSVSPSFAVVDLHKLKRLQVAELRKIVGSDAVLQEAATAAAPKIKQAIQAWSKAHKTGVLSKQAVVSEAVDVTDAVAHLMAVQP